MWISGMLDLKSIFFVHLNIKKMWVIIKNWFIGNRFDK